MATTVPSKSSFEIRWTKLGSAKLSQTKAKQVKPIQTKLDQARSSMPKLGKDLLSLS